MTKTQQEEISYCVGSQFGRVHRRFIKSYEPKLLLEHLDKNLEIS